MATTPNLGMPEITHGETNGEVTHNTDIQILDFHAQPTVVNHAQDGEPVSPVEGSAYVISANPWDGGLVDDIAHFYNGTWHFYTPSATTQRIGWRIISQANLNTYYWSGVFWGLYTNASMLVHDMTVDADYTLTLPEAQHQTLKITDVGVVLTGGVNIVVPDTIKQYSLINATGQTLVLKTAAGVGVAVITAKNAILFCDGVDVLRLSGDS